MHGADWSAGASRRPSCIGWCGRMWPDCGPNTQCMARYTRLSRSYFPSIPPPPLSPSSPHPHSLPWQRLYTAFVRWTGRGALSICTTRSGIYAMVCMQPSLSCANGVICTYSVSYATACSKGEKLLMRHALRLPHPPLQMPANASNSPKTLMGGPGTGPRV